MLPCLPGVVSLLPKDVQRWVLRPVKSNRWTSSAWTYLCWRPYCAVRCRILHTLVDVQKSVYVRWPSVSVDPPVKRGLRIVAVSDTHNLHKRLTLPDGDVLVHAGDLLRRGGDRRSLEDVAAWIRRQPHKRKLVIGGNHDHEMEDSRGELRALFDGAYCEDETVDVDGFTFVLSPFSHANSPRSLNTAFQSHGAYLKTVTKCDVLVTHGPPKGVLDGGTGSPLIKEVVDRLNPQVHIFGHQHNCPGVVANGTTLFINATNTDGLFALTKPPVVIDLPVLNRHEGSWLR